MVEENGRTRCCHSLTGRPFPPPNIRLIGIVSNPVGRSQLPHDARVDVDGIDLRHDSRHQILEHSGGEVFTGVHYIWPPLSKR